MASLGTEEGNVIRQHIVANSPSAAKHQRAQIWLVVTLGPDIKPRNVGKHGGDLELLKTPANVFFAVK